MPMSHQTEELFAAIEAGDLAHVKKLVKEGAKLGSHDKLGRTPLWVAAQDDQEDIFYYLLKHGSKPNVTNQYGWTPLTDVCKGDTDSRLRMLEALLKTELVKKKGAVQDAMLAAACHGSPEMVQMLIDAGADVRKKDRDVGSYLLAAVSDNPRRAEVVPVLLAAGVDPNVRRPPGEYDGPGDKKYHRKTALEIAEIDKLADVAELLRAAATADPAKTRPAAAQRDGGPTTVIESWGRVTAWLKQNAPKWTAAFKKPATEQQIVKAEKQLDGTLPTDLKDTYLLYNGTDDLFPTDGDGTFFFLPLSELTADWLMQCDLLETGEFDGKKVKADKGVKAEWWNENWVPFAGNGAGDFFCADLDPAKGGTAEQVIFVSHEGAKRRLLAPSIREWLSSYADSLEAGDYRYEVEEGLVPQ